ncbi:uncharacterized protein LOC133561933 [Nerophis ophidion]|uniref:uncharacterized protein LOC133561933 n=1 Tax=Nerophis ophidion TaxID=159077 RepID=UPI002AE00C09|nr:uncharacterized protein LOC133561933 [Nerophis ophidion]
MTAASSNVSSPASCRSPPACLPCHLRKGGTTRTQLHMRSAPGVWLMVGMAVVLTGMSVAVVGYVSAVPKAVGGRGGSHVERMKLSGPVVMGVGLFIFICAATLLYENRDREVHRLETSDDLEDLNGDLGWDDSEKDSFDSQEQWEEREGDQVSNQNWALYPPPLSLVQQNQEDIGREGEDEKEKEGKSTLLARVQHHQEPSPQSSCGDTPLSPRPQSSAHVDFENCNKRTASVHLPEPLPSQRV